MRLAQLFAFVAGLAVGLEGLPGADRVGHLVAVFVCAHVFFRLRFAGAAGGWAPSVTGTVSRVASTTGTASVSARCAPEGGEPRSSSTGSGIAA